MASGIERRGARSCRHDPARGSDPDHPEHRAKGRRRNRRRGNPGRASRATRPHRDGPAPAQRALGTSRRRKRISIESSSGKAHPGHTIGDFPGFVSGHRIAGFVVPSPSPCRWPSQSEPFYEVVVMAHLIGPHGGYIKGLTTRVPREARTRSTSPLRSAVRKAGRDTAEPEGREPSRPNLRGHPGTLAQ